MAKTLVCRCEDVTLHELEEAVARGHDDLESLKRYTGFGTGWCQGKHCVALCARELVARGGSGGGGGAGRLGGAAPPPPPADSPDGPCRSRGAGGRGERRRADGQTAALSA